MIYKYNIENFLNNSNFIVEIIFNKTKNTNEKTITITYIDDRHQLLLTGEQ